MFRADVGMVEGFGFLACERQHFFDAWSIRNITDHLGFRARADLLLHLHAHGLEIETHLLQNVHGHSLPQFNESQKEVFSADVVVIKAVGLFASKRQNLLSARREIIHYSMARQSSHRPIPSPSY